jgi:hypothetical protein
VKIKPIGVFISLFVFVIVALASLPLLHILGTLFDWQWIVPDNTKIRLEEYLKENFEQEITIGEYKFNSFSKDYLAIVYPSNYPEIRFIVQLYSDGEVSHNYYEVCWSKKAEDIVREIIKGVMFDNINVSCMLKTFGGPAFYPPYTIGIYNKYSSLYDQLPKYSQVKEELTNYLQIYVDLSSDYSEDKSEGVLTVISLVYKEVPFNFLDFEYENASFRIDGTNIPEDIMGLNKLLRIK